MKQKITDFFLSASVVFILGWIIIGLMIQASRPNRMHQELEERQPIPARTFGDLQPKPKMP